jgi:hypothetical protein
LWWRSFLKKTEPQDIRQHPEDFGGPTVYQKMTHSQRWVKRQTILPMHRTPQMLIQYIDKIGRYVIEMCIPWKVFALSTLQEEHGWVYSRTECEISP